MGEFELNWCGVLRLHIKYRVPAKSTNLVLKDTKPKKSCGLVGEGDR